MWFVLMDLSQGLRGLGQKSWWNTSCGAFLESFGHAAGTDHSLYSFEMSAYGFRMPYELCSEIQFKVIELRNYWIVLKFCNEVKLKIFRNHRGYLSKLMMEVLTGDAGAVIDFDLVPNVNFDIFSSVLLDILFRAHMANL